MRGVQRRSAIALTAALLLASCGKIVPPATAPGPPAANALSAGVRVGPQVSKLGLGKTGAAASLASFRESCPRLVSRNDTSGLTRTEDWKPSCDAAARWPVSDAPSFFTRFFGGCLFAAFSRCGGGRGGRGTCGNQTQHDQQY